MTGFHDTVYTVIDLMPGRNVHDYENIIARLRAIPTYVYDNIELSSTNPFASCMMQPRLVADLVIGQLEAQMKQDVSQTELLKAFRSFPAYSVGRAATLAGRGAGCL